MELKEPETRHLFHLWRVKSCDPIAQRYELEPIPPGNMQGPILVSAYGLTGLPIAVVDECVFLLRRRMYTAQPVEGRGLWIATRRWVSVRAIQPLAKSHSLRVNPPEPIVTRRLARQA